MSDDKKDLTRIEDLAEYIHELEEESQDDPFGESLPDLPQEESSFGEEDEIPAFDAQAEGPESLEEATDFGSSETVFGSGETDFGSSETDFGSGETDFGSGETDFGSGETDFGSSETDFGSSETDFGSSETDFGSSETDFGSSETELDSSETDIGADSNLDVKEESPASDESTEITDTFTSSTEQEPKSDFSDDDLFAASSPQEESSTPIQSPTSEPDLEPEPVQTATPLQEEKTLLQSQPLEQETYKAPENFADLKQFSESSSFTGMGAEGNPSFSVLIKNVRYVEDVSDIMVLMKELGLIGDSEDQMRSRLMRGSLLVPRISEFAAILLAHKLRRFDVDILVGLSDEIHPPKHGEAPETGIVSKHNLYQNQAHHFHFDDPKLEISQIIVAATPALEGHQVVRYLGVASEHKMVDGHLVDDEASAEVPRFYQELAQKLKAHALRAHANAVVGLNYQLTPLPSEYGVAGAKYRLTCTGNLVWVNKL